MYEYQQKTVCLSKKIVLLLAFIPFISCANNSSTIPEIAYGTPREITSDAKTINHSQWNDLLQKHVSTNGNVDYKGFQKDAVALQSYLDLLAKNLPQKSWSKNAVLAYWINAYNAYTVKLILDNYPVKSIKKIDNPWDKDFFTLGDKKYSLGEIEHKILRKMNEPRIHFAINCASYSCPNLSNKAYSETELDKQLDAAAKSFVNDTTKNTFTSDRIEISSIFDWFSGDFKTKGTLIDFLNKYSTIKINTKAKVKYKDYNWNLNE
ncbi:DUF547 domain-containing protein [Flavobacterium cellulosilyticum]|uniref:DUF547 domain-containing protein n=2 Tax=Flavobacterium cellulosilyticum TaxID=2541731 RepID=A0A4R5CBK6_9FLAO|nr:DUF547 domain-containing protein [Flavobacterium cellulosilyticum]